MFDEPTERKEWPETGKRHYGEVWVKATASGVLVNERALVHFGSART